MKPLAAKLALYILMAVTISAFAVSAQISTQIVFRMSRPFVVGNTTFPEGNFVIRRSSRRRQIDAGIQQPARWRVHEGGSAVHPRRPDNSCRGNRLQQVCKFDGTFAGISRSGETRIPADSWTS